MNWGQGIAIFLAIFVGFMATLAIKASSNSVDLEAEDYYAQEIEYQGQIDALNRGRALDKELSIKSTQKGIEFTIDIEKIEGPENMEIHFFRPNNSKQDQHLNVDLSSGSAMVASELLAKGKYNLLMSFQKEGKAFAMERSIVVVK